MAGRYFRASGSPWNTPLPADAPIHPNNDAYIADLARMQAAASVAGGWSIGRNSFSCPLYEVTPAQSRVPVTLLNGTVPYPQAQDGNSAHELAWIFAQGVPIPLGAVPAAGTDKHMAIINMMTGELWEFWNMVQNSTTGRWTAKWGGYMADHRPNIGRFENSASPRSFIGWGAAASSLPMPAGLVLGSELAAGYIPHALQAVLPEPEASGAFVWPAQRGDGRPAGIIPEGSILRIKQSVNTSLFTGPNTAATRTRQTFTRAMQEYGVIFNDRSGAGSPMSIRMQPNLAVSDTTALGLPVFQILSTLNTADMEFISPSYRPAPPAVPVSEGETWGALC